MRDAGKTNFAGLGLLLVVASLVFVAVKVVPFYVDNLDVKEAVEAAHNLSGRNKNDGILREEIRQRTKHMGEHVERDSWGVDQVVPGLGLTDDNILIERSPVTENVLIEVTYERVVDFSPIPYTHVLQMRAAKEGVPPR